MKTLIKNAGNIDFDIMIEDGNIVPVCEKADAVIDLDGDYIFPGLVDIHSHGCINYDTTDGTHLFEMSEHLAKNGITSWLPTTMTVSIEDIKKVVNIELPKWENAANVLGFHLEGPYIANEYKGAQNEKYIKNPDIDEFNTFKNAVMVTIAPELDGSAEFIEKCPAVVSLGHSGADYETALEAMDKGAMCLTHTLNAMTPFHHRSPGLVGAAIEKNIYIQVICDGLHLHKSVVTALYRTFGADRVVLISDSMRACGMPDGKYDLGGQDVYIKNKVARLADGTIAGSTSTLFDCVKKAIEFGIPMNDAFKMASQTPATLIKANKGRFDTGYDADFVILNKDLEIKDVMINGKMID